MKWREFNAAIDECFSKNPDREHSSYYVHKMLHSSNPGVRKSTVFNRIALLTAQGWLTTRTAEDGVKRFRWAGRKAHSLFPAGQIHMIDRESAPGVLYSLRAAGRPYRVILKNHGSVRNAEALLRLGLNADEPYCRAPGGCHIVNALTHIKRDVAKLPAPDTLLFDFESIDAILPHPSQEAFFLSGMQHIAERYNVAVILSAENAERVNMTVDEAGQWSLQSLQKSPRQCDRKEWKMAPKTRRESSVLTPSMTAWHVEI